MEWLVDDVVHSGNKYPPGALVCLCGRKFLPGDGDAEIARKYAARNSCYLCAERETYPLNFTHPNEYYIEKCMSGSGRTVGFEIELNPTFPDIVMLGMKRMAFIKTDGSLRGRGYEIVSPILRESNAEAWVREAFFRMDAKLYNRCGYHLWVGTKDLSHFDIARLIILCRKYEGVFSSIVSPSRRPIAAGEGNAGGRPQQLPAYAYHGRNDLLQFIYGSGVLWSGRHGYSTMRMSKRMNDHGRTNYRNGKWNRYMWLNPHGHWNRRAVEIRLHQSTTNPTKILNWMRLWVQVIDHIQRGFDIANPLNIISDDLAEYYRNRAIALAGLSERKYVYI